MPLIKRHSKKDSPRKASDASDPKERSLAIAYSIKRNNSKKTASPMPSQAPSSDDVSDHYDSIADAILAKKKSAKMMADGGMVDLDENAEEDQGDSFDQMNQEAGMKELYDDSASDPMSPDQDSASIESDDDDMISKIRSKMRAKRSMR